MIVIEKDEQSRKISYQVSKIIVNRNNSVNYEFVSEAWLYQKHTCYMVNTKTYILRHGGKIQC